jgi:putative nucleotidyltransferase with HDIG domain
MKEKAFLFLKEWFHQYVKSFYSEDEELQFNVRLKEEHTLRVLVHAENIAIWLQCSIEQRSLIKIAALLHDIGRFKQYQTYRTFVDSRSVNHAQLGADVLQGANILVHAGLSEEQQEIVMKAVLYHNQRQLTLEEKRECVIAANITRDADKLDIFSMLVTDDERNKIPPTVEFQRTELYSTKIVRDVLEGRLAEYSDIITSSDQMLFRLSWIYDMYFSYSSAYVLEQGYLEKLIALLPDTEDIRLVYQCLQQYAKSHAANDNFYFPASYGDV